MITQDIKIPTDGRPIEAFTMFGDKKPAEAFLVLPGQGYTINHFLLDFLWRMAAESGFLAIKAEYRGYTYRHLGEPYDYKQAAIDTGFVLDYLEEQGYSSTQSIVCAKSLGTIALATIAAKRGLKFNKAVLLTPVLYTKREEGVFPGWLDFQQSVQESMLVFGTNDEYCDPDSAKTVFPKAIIDYRQGADHELSLENNYTGTIEMNREIIEKVKKFITK